MSHGAPQPGPASPRRHVLLPREIGGEARRPPRGWRVHALGGRTMGTSWSVTVAAPPAHPLGPVREGVEAVLARVVAEMSPWEAASDISRFNAAPPGTWHALPPSFWTVLTRALALAEATGGAYDPTLGAVVDLWGFGPGSRAPAIPDARLLDEARAAGGWRRLALDPATRRVRQPGGLRLDLSSIAKGFAVDAVGACLNGLGLAHHLVEIGGELRGAGVKPDGSPWWVAVETPPGAAGAEEWLAALHGLAVATSGDYRRWFSADGAVHAHTIDPRTGRPVVNRLASVTVFRSTCLEADALATALLVLGPEEGLAFAREHGLAALFLARDAAGLRATPSPALSAMLDEDPPPG